MNIIQAISKTYKVSCNSRVKQKKMLETMHLCYFTTSVQNYGTRGPKLKFEDKYEKI